MDPEEPTETILQWMFMLYFFLFGCVPCSLLYCCIPFVLAEAHFLLFLNLRLFLGFLVSSACFNLIFVAVTLSKTFT